MSDKTANSTQPASLIPSDRFGSNERSAVFGPDFTLVSASEKVAEAYKIEVLSKATLWDLYPELKRSDLLAMVRSVINGGKPCVISLGAPREQPCDLYVARTKHGLAVREMIHSAEMVGTLPNKDKMALLIHQATHDVLTGLANRRQFRDDLGSLIAGDVNDLALMQIDLDEFKPVNDTLGHGAGDIVLQLAAHRIGMTLGDGERAYRLAGDEFAILQSRSGQPAEAERLAEILIRDFEKPFTVNGISVFVGASIGIAIAPRDGNASEQLMKAADVALYAAKRDGGGRAKTFDADMLVVLEQRELLRRSLRVALTHRQFFIEYQPLVSPSLAVVGFEALLRWQHPILGVIPPASFIPIAETDGLMGEIGQWVLEEACKEALNWPPNFILAVNLSPAEFLTNDLTDRISQTLDMVGFPAERLELEITETVLLERTMNNLDTLNTLNVLGIRISLDDFGTKYSSLSYLKNFPFDNIKIDRYFIKDVITDTKSQTIVRCVIALAQGLGMRVTAEGVETEEQVSWLKNKGCDRLQGNFLTPPLPAEALADFIRKMAADGLTSERQ